MTRLARLVAALVAVLGGTSPAFAIGHGYSGSAPASSADWSVITGFPAACSAGSFIQQLGSPTNTCASNASTATALAANGTNCSANQAAGGVDAGGNAESCVTPLLSPGAVTSGRMVLFSGTGGQSTSQSTCSESAGAISGCSLSGNASTATALAADPTDCSAGQYATTIAASGNLTCAQVQFSQLGGTLAHSSLSGLTSGDDHTQYALLAGRSGGQTLKGGTAASNTLVLNSTSNATKGTIDLDDQTRVWPSLSSASAGGYMIGAAPSFTDSTGVSFYGFQYNPTITASNLVSLYFPALRSSGTCTASTATLARCPAILYDNTTQSSTAAVSPPVGVVLQDNGVMVGTGGVAVGAGNRYSVLDNSTSKSTTSSTTFTANAFTVYSKPNFTQTAGTLTGNRYAVKVATPATSGSPTMTDNIGVDIDASTVGTNIVGFRSALAASGTARFNIDITGTAPVRIGTAALVETPGALTFGNGANDSVAITSSFNRITGPTGAYNWSGTSTCIDGQRLTMWFTVSQTLTIKNNVTSTCKILTLTGADVAMTASKAVIAELVYSSNDSGWILLSARDASGVYK